MLNGVFKSIDMLRTSDCSVLSSFSLLAFDSLFFTPPDFM
jgi:hypothetical protein